MITRIYIENFKAIYKAADFDIQPFTIFIGNNGTGKSSIVEALRALQTAGKSGLNEAFKEWGGLDKIMNYNAAVPQSGTDLKMLFHPLTIGLSALVNEKTFDYNVKINVGPDGVYYVVEEETLHCNGTPVFTAEAYTKENRPNAIFFKTYSGKITHWPNYNPNRLFLGYHSPPISAELDEFTKYVEEWQFLYLNAHKMGRPVQQERVFRTVKLDYEGGNIADYLLWLKNQGQEYLDSLIDKMRFVLPYITDLQPHILEETINREVELLLKEDHKNSQPLPGWLLSSGTLRILALLAMFETPKKPSVLFVDEVENGLDPRTLALLLSQVESVFSDKSMQVVFTTHSPYLLDLVPLESVIVAEKDNEGSTYHIPNNEASLKLWRDKFSPGRLYTMGKLTK